MAINTTAPDTTGIDFALRPTTPVDKSTSNDKQTTSSTVTTGVTIAANICRVGDIVTAKDDGGGEFDATIASIDGNMITINYWSNNNPKHRRIPKEEVFKNGMPCEVATFSNICRLGDIVKAKYNGGVQFDANIASIDGDMIIVNWSNNYPEHRRMPKQDVFKDGMPCEAVDQSGAKPLLAITTRAASSMSNDRTSIALSLIMLHRLCRQIENERGIRDLALW